MLESHWSEALASNNIRAIIRWLRRLTAEGAVDMEETLRTFSSWAQRTSEFAKKELLTLCFSRCQGLWMFLDQSSFTRVHMLLQRLRNLLSLAQWARRQLSSAHLWHGVGIPCAGCRDANGSSEVRRSCWNREHRALRQHIWLGQLVQWWGIMGLLPKCPEPHEVKRISQMWKEMDHSHRKACLETPGLEDRGMERWSSFIQALVTQLDKQHGCLWTSEDCTQQCYPPPNLQALLKLVLVPQIDNMSVQAILMYFTLDMTNFLQCKDDLLHSFSHAFTIPSSFSQQIRAFWMLDHGHVKASMELLLSPGAATPCLSWQHRCIIRCLLARRQPQLALRYFHWTRPAMESVEDAKLCADVLLQNSCVSDAWALLKRSRTDSDDMVMYFLQACDGFGLCAEALKYIPVGYNVEGDVSGTAGMRLQRIKKDFSEVQQPCPLSAKLYQVNTSSPEELVQLARNAVMEVSQQNPKISEVVWPERTERKTSSREMFLAIQALRRLTPSPSPADMDDSTERAADDPEEKHPALLYPPEAPAHLSSSESSPGGDLSSGSSFTSALSLPLLRRDRVYESTLTLQRMSSLLTDGENQCREEEEEDEEEEESRTPSPFAVLDCPELATTLDGDTDPISPDTGIFVESMHAEEGRGDVKTGVEAGFPGAFMDETPPPHERMFRIDLPSHFNEESSLSELQVDSRSLPSPEHGKMAGGKGASADVVLPNDTTLRSSAVPLNTDDQSDRILPQTVSFGGADASDCFIKASQSLLLDMSAATGSVAFTGTIKTSEAQSHTDEAHIRSSSDQCTLGSWWNQDLENLGGSRSLLAAAQPGAAVESDKKSSLGLSQPYSLLSFMDFTAKQKSNKSKQADKEETAGWKVSQGAMRSGRTRSRKSKQAKRS